MTNPLYENLYLARVTNHYAQWAGLAPAVGGGAIWVTFEDDTGISYHSIPGMEDAAHGWTDVHLAAIPARPPEPHAGELLDGPAIYAALLHHYTHKLDMAKQAASDLAMQRCHTATICAERIGVILRTLSPADVPPWHDYYEDARHARDAHITAVTDRCDYYQHWARAWQTPAGLVVRPIGTKLWKTPANTYHRTLRKALLAVGMPASYTRRTLTYADAHIDVYAP